MRPRRRAWWRVGTTLLTAGGVLYLLWAFQRAGMAAFGRLDSLPASTIVTAVALETLVILGGAVLWHATARVMGVEVGLAEMLGAWWRASLARFVPGKVWPFVAMAAHGRVSGLAAAQLPATLAVHTALSIVAATMVALTSGGWTLALSAAVAAVAVAGLLSQPTVVVIVRRVVAFLPGIEQVRWERFPRRALVLLLAQVALWVAHAAAFLVLARGVVALPVTATHSIIGAVTASFVAGAVGSLAPAGLIVRDATLAAFLGSMMPADAAAALMVIARLWSLAAEGVALIFAAAISRRTTRRDLASRNGRTGALSPITRASPESAALPRVRDVAVVIPAFDEAENVAALFVELRAAFARHAIDGEIVFVDDGSTDDTFRIARREAAPGRDRVLRHAVNRGKTEALLTGAAATSCERIVLFDADLQHDPDDIPRLLAPLDDGWDIVTGRKVGAYRKRLVSLVYNAVSRRVFRVPVRDLNSIKAFRREVLVTVPLRHDWHRYLVALAVARGFSVTEIDVALRPRRAGRSKYDGVARVFSGCRDLAAVWWHIRSDRSAEA